MSLTVTRSLPPLTNAKAAPALKKFANDLMIEASAIYISNMPRDTGQAANLAQPGAGTTKVEGSPIPTFVRVGTNANRGGVNYLGVLDYSDKRRGAGKAPPVKAIERWLARKGMSASKRPGQKRAPSRRDFAFMIAKSIAKQGQQHPFKYVGTSRKGTETKGWLDRVRQQIDVRKTVLAAKMRQDLVAVLNAR